MRIDPTVADAVVLQELGKRVAAVRLARNPTQAGLAEQAGVAKRTIERLESGQVATQLSSFVRVCRVLGLLERFDALIPEPGPSPIAQLKLQGRKRQRASGTRLAIAEAKPKQWRWGFVTIAEVRLWGRSIGAVALQPGHDHAAFEYDSAFIGSGIEISPLMLPLGPQVYTFPELPLQSFHGLPGLLADSLPDKFGNALINARLATQGRSPDHFDAVERLCYTGSRGMGALEFAPARGPKTANAERIEIDALVKLASEVLSQRVRGLHGDFSADARAAALADILRVGTSAGGARAKAVIAWNRATNEVCSGQITASQGFEYWLLKFDGVTGNKDKELEDPSGYGAVEYAYHLMARAAGIAMSECRLLEEHGRRHFATRRFDRLEGGGKLHMLSLGALAHFDFNQAGAYAYEQAFMTIRQLGLPMAASEEQFRRMLFNFIARNQDDHVKNIAFWMDQQGQWSLAPAFDVTYSYNPSGSWTARHQMTINGKHDGFVLEDFKACARSALLKRGRALAILEQVQQAVRRWPEFAEQAQLADSWRQSIQASHRLSFAAT